MNGLSTWLSDRVESLLPRTAAAACISPSHYCSQYRICFPDGSCTWAHSECRISCHGKTVSCRSYFGKC
jgi:hypothetical protein